MECPQCRLFNPDTALRCDCGYNFENYQRMKTENKSENCSVKIKNNTVWLMITTAVLFSFAIIYVSTFAGRYYKHFWLYFGRIVRFSLNSFRYYDNVPGPGRDYIYFWNTILSTIGICFISGFLLFEENQKKRAIKYGAHLAINACIICLAFGLYVGYFRWDFLLMPMCSTLAYGFISGIVVSYREEANPKINYSLCYFPLIWASITIIAYIYIFTKIFGYSNWYLAIGIFPTAVLAGTYIVVSHKRFLALFFATVITLAMMFFSFFIGPPILIMYVHGIGYLAALAVSIIPPLNYKTIIILAAMGFVTVWISTPFVFVIGYLHYGLTIGLLMLGLNYREFEKRSNNDYIFTGKALIASFGNHTHKFLYIIIFLALVVLPMAPQRTFSQDFNFYAAEGNVMVLKTLLNRTRDFFLQDETRKFMYKVILNDALRKAARNGHTEVVELLKQHGAIALPVWSKN